MNIQRNLANNRFAGLRRGKQHRHRVADLQREEEADVAKSEKVFALKNRLDSDGGGFLPGTHPERSELDGDS